MSDRKVVSVPADADAGGAGAALPFEPLVPNVATVEAMKEARHGGLTSFASLDVLMADLNTDD